MFSSLSLFAHKDSPNSRDLKLKIINHTDDPLLHGVKDTLFLAIPGTVTIKQLKERVHGKIHLPLDRIMFFYCGSLLKDKDNIPDEAYEPPVAVNLEVEIFKPRIHLMLKTSKDSTIDHLILHAVDEDEEAKEARLAAERLRAEEERLAKERQMLIKQLRLARDTNKDEIVFDLAEELVPINCYSFCDILRENGYGDVVRVLFDPVVLP